MNYFPLLIIFSSPLFWKNKYSISHILIFLTIYILIRLTQKSKKKIYLLLFSIGIIVISNLYFDKIINPDLTINIDRTYIYDQKQIETISDFRFQATYLIYPIRRIIFSKWIILCDTFNKFFNYFWFNNIINTIGLASLVPFILGVAKHLSYYQILIIFLGIISGTISRNPNTSLMFLFISPVLFDLTIAGSKYIKNKTLIFLILINFIFSITA
jgi:hypothetical protein